MCGFQNQGMQVSASFDNSASKLSPALQKRRSKEIDPILGRLPDPILESMVSGLEENGDKLCYGTLFTSDGGGCAVGIILQDLFFKYQKPKKLPFFRPYFFKRNILDVDRNILQEAPALRTLQHAFDRVVMLAREYENFSKKEALKETGIFFKEKAIYELQQREKKALDGTFVPLEMEFELTQKREEKKKSLQKKSEQVSV